MRPEHATSTLLILCSVPRLVLSSSINSRYEPPFSKSTSSVTSCLASPSFNRSTFSLSSTLLSPLPSAPSETHESSSSSNLIRQDIPTTTYPAYLPLTENPTDGCDIYGPLCQSGSIAVQINNTDTVATTTIPCSSYLSAQAHTISTDLASYSNWLTSFGRSPQCTSFAAAERKHPQKTVISSLLSSCPALKLEPALTALPLSGFTPAGIRTPWLGDSFMECCGPCAIKVDQVQLAYFPEESDTPCSKTINTSAPSVTPAMNIKDARTSIYVTDGFTYTSPSIYFEIVGTAKVGDECGPIGARPVTSTIAVPPGVMSSLSFDVPVGSTVPPHPLASGLRHILPLNLRDLACPTWGLSGPIPSTGLQGMLIGPPFYPLLLPPPELFNLDPAWSKCVGNRWPLKFGIFDPPRALTANGHLMAPNNNNDAPSPTHNPAVVAEPADALTTTNLDAGFTHTPAPYRAQTIPTSTPNSQVMNGWLGKLVGAGRFDAGVNGQGDPPSGSTKPQEGQIDSSAGSPTDHLSPTPCLTIGQSIYTPNTLGDYVLSPTQTLLPGGPPILLADGPTISLAGNGAFAIIGEKTQILSPSSTVTPGSVGTAEVPSEYSAGKGIEGGMVDGGVEGTEENTSRTPTEHSATTQVFPNAQGNQAITAAPLFLTGGNGKLKGTNGDIVLGISGSVLATLFPGGSGYTLSNGDAFSLDRGGVIHTITSHGNGGFSNKGHASSGSNVDGQGGGAKNVTGGVDMHGNANNSTNSSVNGTDNEGGTDNGDKNPDNNTTDTGMSETPGKSGAEKRSRITVAAWSTIGLGVVWQITGWNGL